MSREKLSHPVIESAVGAAAGTALLVGATISRVHRGVSHRSLQFDPMLGRVVDTVIEPYTDPSSWSAAHRDHHNGSDTNHKPAREKFDYAVWREQNPDKSRDLPDFEQFYDGIDPVARQVSIDTVLKMGELIGSKVEGKYLPPTDYTEARALEITRNDPLAFTYKNISERARRLTPNQWPKGYAPTLDDIDHLLMDPHSPALLEGGARPLKFVRNMIPLYRANERMWDSNDQLPHDLARDEYRQFLFSHREFLIKAYSTAVVLGTVGVHAALGDRKLTQLFRNALVGGGIAAGMGGGLVAGGIITNYIGHLGKDPYYTMRTGIIIPHEDGTLATNGNVLFGWITGDEAGWQGNHHAHPEWIAFAERFFQAPAGVLQEKLANKNLLGLGRGKGFDGERPDAAHAATIIMEAERVRTVHDGLYPGSKAEAERYRRLGRLPLSNAA